MESAHLASMDRCQVLKPPHVPEDNQMEQMWMVTPNTKITVYKNKNSSYIIDGIEK